MTTVAVRPTDQQPAGARRARTTDAPRRPSFARVAVVELRKMFDTRSGFWLMPSIVIANVLATTAVVLWAPEDELTYSTFATAIGFPMAVILPMIAILSVTSEWSQRSGLTTFALVPHRGRVVLAKAVCTVAVGVVSMLVAMVVGALGNLVGTAVTGTELVWDASFTDLLHIVLGNVLGMMVGFMLGVLIRSSAGAIVSYFVYTLVLPDDLRPAGRSADVVPGPPALGRLQLRAECAVQRRDDEHPVGAPRCRGRGLARAAADGRADAGDALRGEVSRTRYGAPSADRDLSSRSRAAAPSPARPCR